MISKQQRQITYKFGYKTNRTGFSLGTGFELFDDVSFGVGTSNFYEKMTTNSTASARQKLRKLLG